MGLMKIFKFAKKGSKKVKRTKGAAPGGEKWPPGIRIGVFGHENTGKTVYFTVLYHQSKIAKDLQISVTDKLTSVELLANYMSIWGLGSGTPMGTIIDQLGEKKFPEPTEQTTVLQFTAILDGKKKVPVVTCDYNGRLVSIAEHSDEAERLKDFMAGADGLLFFFDPKIMGADLEVQKRASAFVNILEYVAPLESRLPIPVALVITKADTLPGYTGEERTRLISPEDEQFNSEKFIQFVEKVMGSEGVAGDPAWSSSVRKVLERLREFLKVVVGRTLDFQVFFVSNTGNEPVKIGTDVGRSLYKPPDKINPCGIKEPFHWILHSALRNRRLNVMRRFTKFAVAASIIWMALYSLPFVIHFTGYLGRTLKTEDTILKSLDGNHLLISENQANEIGRAYDRYSRRFLVKQMFPEYRQTASDVREMYRNIDLGFAMTKLDNIINEMRKVIETEGLHPRYNAVRDSMAYTDAHVKMLEELGRMKATDPSSVLSQRSGRALDYWELFTQWVKNPGDSTVEDNIGIQVENNQQNAQQYSDSERALGQALAAKIGTARAKPRAASTRNIRSSLEEYDRFKKKINDSKDAEYVLDKAVEEAGALKAKLIPGTHADQIASLDRFISRAAAFKKRQKYVLVLQAVPSNDHLHIEVTEKGKPPKWETFGMHPEGDRVEIYWKMGDEIHIAYDEVKFKCTSGKTASDKRILGSLFDLAQPVTFSDINKTVTISVQGGLTERLPKIE